MAVAKGYSKAELSARNAEKKAAKSKGSSKMVAPKGYTSSGSKSVFTVNGQKFKTTSQARAEELAADLVREKQLAGGRQAEELGSGVDGVPIRNYEQTNPYGYYGTKDNQFPNTSRNPRAPTVVSNASVMERLIPSLQSQANALSSSTFSGVGGEGGIGGSEGESDINIDEILGLPGKKEKKKKDLSYKEGTNLALPYGYWEESYGDAAPQMRQLAEMQRQNNAVARESIAAIRNQFNVREQQMEAANNSNLQGVKNALQLGGSSRYAPVSSAGIITAQEQAGIRALADLDASERSAIAEVKQAQQQNDWKVVEQKLATLETIRQEKAAATEALTAEVQGNTLQAERDNEIAALVAQGITDPVEMIQTLNANGGDFTFSEIVSSLKGLKDLTGGFGATGFALDEKQTGKLLGGGWTAPDIQGIQQDIAAGFSINDILANVQDPNMKASLQDALGFTPGAGPMTLTPGVGAQSPEDEFIIRQRLFPKLATILNKGQLSDSDREVINGAIASMRDMGMNEQQILDTYSGWSSDVNTPYNNSFRDIILTASKDGTGTPTALSNVGSKLARGNYIGAMKDVENLAMLRAKELDPDGYMSNVATDTYTKRIDRIKALMKRAGMDSSVGFVEGSFQKLLKRIKGPDAAQIQAELRQLYQTFRKENSGVAVTPSEEAYLTPLFADINDPEGNFMVKLDVFQQGILDRHNATRSVVGLPPVRVLDVLDPAERLTLYAGNVTSDGATTLGI